MTEIDQNSGKGWALIRWLFAAAFLIAVIASGIFSGPINKAGLLYLVFGSVATALMGFTGREIVAAFRQAAGVAGAEESLGKSAHFWEAVARNSWVLGALGSALNFTIALGSESGGIGGIANRMIQSFVVTLYGLVLAVICLVPSMKLYGKAEEARLRREARPATEAARPPHVTGRSMAVDRIIGYFLFAAVLVLTVLFLIGGQPQSSSLPMDKILLHWPAILVVIGGAIALALFMGAGAGAWAWTLGFVMTGLIGLLAGVIQTLSGFVHKDITEVSTALSFIISASSLSLLGLVAVAAPLEDREVMEGRKEKPSSLSRLFWAIFPLLTFIFLILTFIVIVTPMEKPGG
jgi:MFS family permease